MTLTDQIKQSIAKKSNLTWQEIISSSKYTKPFYIRMIIAYRLKNVLKPKDIARIVNRDRTTVNYYIGKYEGEYRKNRIFRELADKI